MQFSVCIPVYNAEAFLDRCLKSILEQEFLDYELILVDDGSQDHSLEICRKYASTYSQIVVISQQNAGPAAARNAAIERARGDYLLFVDADDWVMPDYFSVLFKAIGASHSSIFYFGCVHDNGLHHIEKTSPAATLTSGSQVLDFLEYQFCKSVSDCNRALPYSSNCDTHSCCNKAIPRSLVGDIRFPVGTVVEEDLRFNLQLLAKADSITIIPDVLYCYQQQSSGSVTTQYNPKKFESKLAAYREEVAFAEKFERPAICNFFQNSLLSYVSSCVNNLCYHTCPLSFRQKIQEIRRFFSASEVQEAVAHCTPRSRRTQVMSVLIKHNMVLTCWLIHRIGQWFR